mgnify:CR=1 FL=1
MSWEAFTAIDDISLNHKKIMLAFNYEYVYLIESWKKISEYIVIYEIEGILSRFQWNISFFNEINLYWKWLNNDKII